MLISLSSMIIVFITIVIQINLIIIEDTIYSLCP